jgi:hypothetical protein
MIGDDKSVKNDKSNDRSLLLFCPGDAFPAVHLIEKLIQLGDGKNKYNNNNNNNNNVLKKEINKILQNYTASMIQRKKYQESI